MEDSELEVLLSSFLITSNEALQDELLSISSIYPSLSLYTNKSTTRPSSQKQLTTLRLRLQITIQPSTTSSEEIPVDLLISIPINEYPTTRSPQFQLLSIYLGSYAISDDLFGSILRCYMHSSPNENKDDDEDDDTEFGKKRIDVGEGIEFRSGEVCLFEGIEWCKERCMEWYQVQMRRDQKGVTEWEEEEVHDISGKVGELKLSQGSDDEGDWDPEEWKKWEEEKKGKTESGDRIQELKIWSGNPIIDRKSVFIGHAATVNSQAEVDAVMSELLSDKKIAKASHNITAFRFFDSQTNALYHDVDDDGETAAGGRLGHLLNLLEVENVLVVVTRWYGGTQLGADRFKDINQAARDALIAGGFVHDTTSTKEGSKRRKGG